MSSTPQISETIEFQCSGCGRALKVPASAAGKRASCPQCSTIVQVPMLSEQQVGAAVPVAPQHEGIDAKQANLHVEGQLALPPFGDVDTLEYPLLHKGFEVLLAADAVPLAFRVSNEPSDDYPWLGQRIVVTNGSFLLNYPLVNHENRKLAARLIDECGDPGQKVAFIESGAGGPKIVDKEPTGGMPTALELLKVWPLNAILLHVAVLGLVLCLSRSPIFGRPRELPADSPSDFGKHVAALGKLLAQTKDRNYAHARLMQYRQVADRRSKAKGKMTKHQ